MNTTYRVSAAGLFPLGLVALGLILIATDCGKKEKTAPVPLGEMEMYADPGIGFQLKHPKGWLSNAQVGKAQFFNAPDVSQKFLDPLGTYPIGVMISVEMMKVDDPIRQAKQIKDEMQAARFVLNPEQNVKAGQLDATKLPYLANYGKGNVINGHKVFVPYDSSLFVLEFAGFGDLYEAYQGIFDASLASFVPPKKKVPGRDETLPSETFAEHDAKLFTFLYPDNFNFTDPPKGKNELVLGLRGVRQDCNILVDVFSAQGLTVEKVFDQNKGKFKGATTGSATIGGQKALFLTYPPTKDVERRIYFLVKDDKVYRITLDWYKPHRGDYLAAYERFLNSIKFK
jgi:hypothetical protein